MQICDYPIGRGQSRLFRSEKMYEESGFTKFDFFPGHGYTIFAVIRSYNTARLFFPTRY